MDHATFMEVADEQIKNCLNLLAQKEREYSKGVDRLDQFKNAARVQGCKPIETLAGMMIKHTTSIYKMIKETANGEVFPPPMWEEKITDHINYLLLLKALLIDSTSWGAKTSGPSPLGKQARNLGHPE